MENFNGYDHWQFVVVRLGADYAGTISGDEPESWGASARVLGTFNKFAIPMGSELENEVVAAGKKRVLAEWMGDADYDELEALIRGNLGAELTNDEIDGIIAQLTEFCMGENNFEGNLGQKSQTAETLEKWAGGTLNQRLLVISSVRFEASTNLSDEGVANATDDIKPDEGHDTISVFKG